jgi:hypothetical protein
MISLTFSITNESMALIILKLGSTKKDAPLLFVERATHY